MHGLAAALRDLVFAPVCLGCDGAAGAGRLVCAACRSRLNPLPPPWCPRCGTPRLRTGRAPGPTCEECAAWPAALRTARSAVAMAPPADRLVHAFKYRGWRTLAEPLAEWMAAVPLPADVEAEAGVVVPVPTTPARRRARGYDQAELLARAVARRTRRDVRCVLGRAAGARTQTALQPAARGANVAGAFRVVPGAERELVAAHLLLVDDVLTTGATATECARALVAAGARAASILTFARALDAHRRIAT